MLTDLLLASLHHLLFFALIAMLVAEAGILRGPIDATAIQRLARLDGGYGISATLLLVIGLTRVFHGIKGYDFYLHNPWFHAKLGVFLLAALISIIPTVRYLRWRKALRANPAFVPSAPEIARVRTLVRVQLLAIAAILVLAAAAARFGGF